RLNPQWFSDKLYWAEVSSGTIDVPFMIVWAGTSAYAFVLQSIAQWGMGPGLALTSFIGVLVVGWRMLRGHAREREAVLVLAWTLLNLAYFGGQFAKYLRYLLPVYFTLAILAAYTLLLVTNWLGQVRILHLDRLRGWLAPVVVGTTAIWAVAFSHGI